MSIDTSNHLKYEELEKNLILRRLLRGLYGQVGAQLAAFGPGRVLDAGCGEGHALNYLEFPGSYLGIDMNPDCIAWCRLHHAGHHFEVGTVTSLGLGDRSFDVAICLEVLEHLERPLEALSELVRVADKGVLLSVPFEPVFRLGNLLRGKYRENWGNHPEHVQHWGYRGFRRFLEESGLLRDLVLSVAGPWLVASGRPIR